MDESVWQHEELSFGAEYHFAGFNLDKNGRLGFSVVRLRAVSNSADGQILAVCGELDSTASTKGIADGAEFLTRPHVPKFWRRITPSGCKARAVWG